MPFQLATLPFTRDHLIVYDMRRGVVKGGGARRNYFAVLDELDKPSVLFAPSILEGGGAASAPAPVTDAPVLRLGSLLAPLDAGLGLSSLTSVADEIAAAAAPGAAWGGSWDFSALGRPAPTSTEQQQLAELEGSHRVLEAHLVKVAEKDFETMGGKLARADLSRKQRIRRMHEAARGEAFGSRLCGKVAKQEAARKRRNQVKGAH